MRYRALLRASRLVVVALFFSGWLVGCSPAGVGASIPTQTVVLPSASPLLTLTSTLTASPVVTGTPTPIPFTPTPQVSLCSPLAGYSQADLVAAISNPFKPPRWGSDDPHQAIDLAVQQYGMALAGEPVHVMLEGAVAAVIPDRFPYGNALLVETRLGALPEAWLEQIQAPTPAPTLGPHPALTCPTVEPALTWESGSRSLYLLYAHMQKPPEYTLGDPITCGAQIGLIGQTGNALNPHVHLEVRVGPSSARFNSMAHYSGGITLEEMRNYCAWRVSGVFQLVNPMNLLELLP